MIISGEWHVGDPIGFGNDIGSPEVPYMSYAPKNEEEKQRKRNNLRQRSDIISNEAWKLYHEERYEEAIIFINRALECSQHNPNTWNRKAIILNSMNEYENAIENYNMAIRINSSETYQHNKATCLVDYTYFLRDMQNIESAISKINTALEIFQTIKNKTREDEAWYLKGYCLEKLNNIPEAFNCYRKAIELADNNSMKEIYIKNHDRLQYVIDDANITCQNCGNRINMTDNFSSKCGKHIKPVSSQNIIIPGKGNLAGIIIPIDDEQDMTVERLKSIGRENLITITGSYYYEFDTILDYGVKLRLVRERENIYDSDAIAVYSGDDKIGYVSNSNITNSPFSSKASELENITSDASGEYLINYKGMYHIARINEIN